MSSHGRSELAIASKITSFEGKAISKKSVELVGLKTHIG